ncbi:uncharacterized protein CTRU02_203530 [Colletotrichum truncatum]|uniref:Uncharacterized protein n=1 Tax=Colletotrichum truncatum TaxID=5467 RepID=A0ACC3Z9K7_COLTU|nr:uncharacterized protein CTRU02_05915 [Colletotrichum truncatum]KAF6793659.1 hypothetical protein CTRU02_05915 [Colletotrichum truncatum]
MGREKRNLPGAATAKDRHKRAAKVSKAIDRSEPLPPGLVAAKPMNTVTKSKHQSYFEFIENKDKKKPLLFEITPNRTPPPGMKYIPIGNPELTERCKEISRELGASVYIVTFAKKDASELSQQIHRVGHHIREYIVEQAMHELGQDTFYEPTTTGPNEVEEIPRSQTEINRQADAALRELFPRIPNTDRQQIIDHAFKKGKQFNGELVVGLQQELSLSRRVQLAVLAHIRHNHTRYDELLRETSWHNARRATEQLCLDILVKWRGDDENGRNQLDEILREVVVLSDDSDDEDSGEEPDSDSSAVLTDRSTNAARVQAPAVRQDRTDGSRFSTAVPSRPGSPKPLATPGNQKKVSKKQRKRAKHRERNFSRYEAARNAAWDSAMKRQHQVPNQPGAAGDSVSHGTYPQSQPVVFMEGRAPVTDLGPSHPQRPAPGPFVSNNLHEARTRGDRSFAAPPLRSHNFSSGSTMQKVIESSSAPRPSTMVPKGRPSHHLQDFLHPSIESKSPEAGRPPSRYRRPLVEYSDLADDEPCSQVQSQPRGPIAREEDRYLPRQISQGYSNHTRSFPIGHELSRAPAASYYNAPQDTIRQPAYQVPPQSDPLLRRNEAHLGARGNPIMIEEQRVHPQAVVLGSGEIVRDRFGPDVEILPVRRPARDVGPTPERQPFALDEGFIRLREDRPPEPRDGLREEGFLRIREHPDSIPRRSIPVAIERTSYDDFRSTLDPFRYQPAPGSEQAIYVRRAEPEPLSDFTYPAPGARRAERVMGERLIQRDVPPPVYGGAPHEPYPSHQPQGAYGVPVYRHARPAVRVEEPQRLDRYPPPPPSQPRWPRASDDIIVLE